MDAEPASKVWAASWVWLRMSQGMGCFGSPIPRSSCPVCLFFVDVLRFSVGITKWNSTELLEVTGAGREGTGVKS